MTQKYLLLLGFFSCIICNSQEQQSGNLIPGYGPTFEVESPSFKTETSSELKMVLDVDRSFDPEKPNKLIETAARFLYMHEKAGVNPENMKVALVLHGKAVKDVLKDRFYRNEYPSVEKNPNLPLIEALTNQGVEIILCGQSAAHYKVEPKEIAENVKIALSAMTALVQLQNDNYRLVKF